MALSPAQIRQLPKVDLHRHLDCSMRWSTLLELAPQVGIELPLSATKQSEHFLVLAPMKDLETVLGKFLRAQKVLASNEILTRLSFECCEDAFNDGVRLLELRYAPGFIADGHASLNLESIHKHLLNGIELAEKKFPIGVGLIGILQRTKPLAETSQIADFIVANSGSFVGIDLADNESAAEPAQFVALFERAKKAGLHITIHAGESPHPNAASRIRTAIELLGAERIGHGVQVIHSPELIDFLKAKNIPLEVCLHSNWLTQAFPNYGEHPVRKLWDAGVPLTFNSDDPGIFASTLSDEYFLLQSWHGFTEAEFNQANALAAKCSFLPKKTKNKYWIEDERI